MFEICFTVDSRGICSTAGEAGWSSFALLACISPKKANSSIHHYSGFIINTYCSMETSVVENMSTLTGQSHRFESVVYYMDMFGLDKTSADYLYRAESLLEKRQFDVALKHYQFVLNKHPDCEKAKEEAKLAAELVLDEIKQRKLQAGDNMVSPTEKYLITDMDVEWYAGLDDAIDDMALEAAVQKLEHIGCRNSLLSLKENEILGNEDNVCLRGRAHFKVTLIPDKPRVEDSMDGETERLKEFLATLELDETTHTATSDSYKQELVLPNEKEESFEKSFAAKNEVLAKDDEQCLSRFADASEN